MTEKAYHDLKTIVESQDDSNDVNGPVLYAVLMKDAPQDITYQHIQALKNRANERTTFFDLTLKSYGQSGHANLGHFYDAIHKLNWPQLHQAVTQHIRNMLKEIDSSVAERWLNCCDQYDYKTTAQLIREFLVAVGHFQPMPENFQTDSTFSSSLPPKHINMILIDDPQPEAKQAFGNAVSEGDRMYDSSGSRNLPSSSYYSSDLASCPPSGGGTDSSSSHQIRMKSYKNTTLTPSMLQDAAPQQASDRWHADYPTLFDNTADNPALPSDLKIMGEKLDSDLRSRLNKIDLNCHGEGLSSSAHTSATEVTRGKSTKAERDNGRFSSYRQQPPTETSHSIPQSHLSQRIYDPHTTHSESSKDIVEKRLKGLKVYVFYEEKFATTAAKVVLYLRDSGCLCSADHAGKPTSEIKKILQQADAVVIYVSHTTKEKLKEESNLSFRNSPHMLGGDDGVLETSENTVGKPGRSAAGDSSLLHLSFIYYQTLELIKQKRKKVFILLDKDLRPDEIPNGLYNGKNDFRWPQQYNEFMRALLKLRNRIHSAGIPSQSITGRSNKWYNRLPKLLKKGCH